jgi:hypothetical protein
VLEGAPRYRVEGSTLTLTAEDGASGLVLTAEPRPPS